MRLRALLPFLLLAGACSDDNADAPGALRDTADPNGATVTPDDHTEDEGGDFGQPSDDPSVGGDLGDDTGSPAGAGGDGGASSPAPMGNNCVVGSYYCGGDKVTGDPKTLYLCKGPGTPSVAQRCTTSCTVNAGADDSCAVDPTARAASPVPGKVVTYPFGVKNSSYAAGYHTGDDYATPTGSNAVAVRSGTIRWSNDNGGAYGRWMGLDADNGRTYVYCHLSTRLVVSGTKVKAGQVIAKTGATGNVTGPHLHFEDHPLGNFVYGQVRKPMW